MLPSELIAYAGQVFRCRPKDIIDDKRSVRIHRARMALYLAFWTRAELRGSQPSYKGVGRLVGGRDHSTIIHGLKRARALAETDPEFAQRVLQLVTAKVLPACEEPCNTELQSVEEPDQQHEERSMPTPEDLERTLNTSFQRAGLKALSAYWDGNIVGVDDPVTFGVYLSDEPTDLIVRSHGEDFTVLQRGPRFTTRILGRSSVPSGVADIVRASVYAQHEEAA